MIKKITAGGAFYGFAGGMFIAFICFSMLPFALEGSPGGVFAVSAFMLCGVFASVALEEKSGFLSGLFRLKKTGGANAGGRDAQNAGIALSAGIIIHHFAEGAALSGAAQISTTMEAKMLFIILLHFLPETFAAAVALKKGGANNIFVAALAVIFALPFVIGYGLGIAILPWIPVPAVSSAFLSAAAGIILYASCGAMFPRRPGYAPVIAACFGFAAGLIFAKL